MNLFRQSHRTSEYGITPLLGMIFALILTILPLVDKIAPWVVGAFLMVCVVRLFLNRPGARLPSLPIKLVLFAGGVGGVILSYGTALGIEPGFSILVVLVSLKLIEANGPRDFHVLGVLGFFLALCDLFTSQDLIRWLYVAVILLLLVATLICFHRGGRAASFPRAALFGGSLLLQSAPIAILLFLFFPRVYGGFRFQFSQALSNIGGMSDRMSPGSISSIALSDEVVFRAEFPAGPVPSMATMYWRGGVLWHGDGLNWFQGPPLSPDSERRDRIFSGPPIKQRIILQPHGQHWLFALDHPVSLVRGADYLAGNVLQSRRAVNSRLLYDVVSMPEDHETSIPADQHAVALRVPSHIPVRVQRLVDGWKAGNATPPAIVEAALRYFHQERFVYTVNPGQYNDSRALEEFLFERRQGFCEHYSAAFATLMRIAGIPARVVIGYHGGEYNSLGRYVIVRQADAHAWCEVWLKDAGWIRVDPTEMIAPDRITSSLASFLETHGAPTDPAAVRRSITATGWRELQHEFQLAWDSINYQWDLRVLNFDEDTQRSFLFALGLGSTSWIQIAIWILLGVAIFVAGLAMWLRHPLGAVDKVAQGYVSFCTALARAGLAREPSEGPRHFATRASQHFPDQAEEIERVASLYIDLRYGPTPADSRVFLDAVRRLPRFTTGSKPAG